MLRLEITEKLTSLYEFKLLFCDSRDGGGNGKFHEICDDKPRTVTIVKVENSNEILGGYNLISWKSDGLGGSTKDSFIFSFNNDKIENFILSRMKDENDAISNSNYTGPSFGKSELMI
ncbi:hypothetical protein C1645_839969 [Glomus cerebriforme]|uniref:TLDc domain-containing protein n=1 Tax=Glomus cerebriforme TaxID=658196 RepID=A0A397S606_9GLOM|nr:hypothetical protein C1645_839969 [Glomus cerebriforme]